MVGVDAAGALVGHEVVDARLHRLLGLDDGGVVLGDLVEGAVGEVVADGVGEHEVAVGQALHQRRGAEAVGAVVGEVGLAGDEQAGDRGLQVVVDPQAAHHVVHGRVDPHRDLVGVLARDPGVHVEEVAVLVLDGLAAEALDGLGEVEVDAASYAVDLGADAAALVAHVLGLAGGDVAGDQVAEGGVDPLEVVVAVLLGDLARVLVGVLGVLGHPDAAVVAQRLAHQGQLGLVRAGDRDAGRVDLGVAGVGHVGALAVRAPGGGDVAAHRVGGEEEDVAVAAAGEHHDVGEVGLQLAGDHVAHDDAAGAAVDDDQLDHLVAGVGLHGAGGDLALERLVGADQQLLAGLAAGVEGARDLDAAEGAVVEQAAVLAGEGDALGDALVDDVPADLGEPVDVGLARAVVAALDGVVEEAVDRVAVALVVLGRVDAALGGDRVRAAGGVLVAERLHHVAGLAERGGGRGAGQAGADHDHREPATVGRVGDAGLELAGVPALVDRAAGCLGVADRVAGGVVAGGVVGLLLAVRWCEGSEVSVVSGMSVMALSIPSWRTPYWMTPTRTKTGTSENPPAMTTARTKPNRFGDSSRVRALLVRPRVWAELQMPWCRWAPSIAIATR